MFAAVAAAPYASPYLAVHPPEQPHDEGCTQKAASPLKVSAAMMDPLAPLQSVLNAEHAVVAVISSSRTCDTRVAPLLSLTGPGWQGRRILVTDSALKLEELVPSEAQRGRLEHMVLEDAVIDSLLGSKPYGIYSANGQGDFGIHSVGCHLGGALHSAWLRAK